MSRYTGSYRFHSSHPISPRVPTHAAYALPSTPCVPSVFQTLSNCHAPHLADEDDLISEDDNDADDFDLNPVRGAAASRASNQWRDRGGGSGSGRSRGGRHRGESARSGSAERARWDGADWEGGECRRVGGLVLDLLKVGWASLYMFVCCAWTTAVCTVRIMVTIGFGMKLVVLPSVLT